MVIKRIGLLASAAAAALTMLAADVLAQGRMRMGQGPAHYNVEAEVTVMGTVEDFKPGPGQGTHAMLKTLDGTTLELMLGPTWYQTDKKYEFVKGDHLDVVGAKSTVGGREVLFVREVKKGSETMTFRDAQGFPMWAGRGRSR